MDTSVVALHGPSCQQIVVREKEEFFMEEIFFAVQHFVISLYRVLGEPFIILTG